MTLRNPTAMTIAERQEEIAAILAVGYVRFLAKLKESEDSLAALPEDEASCRSPVNGEETVPRKERA